MIVGSLLLLAVSVKAGVFITLLPPTDFEGDRSVIVHGPREPLDNFHLALDIKSESRPGREYVMDSSSLARGRIRIYIDTTPYARFLIVESVGVFRYSVGMHNEARVVVSCGNVCIIEVNNNDIVHYVVGYQTVLQRDLVFGSAGAAIGGLRFHGSLEVVLANS